MAQEAINMYAAQAWFTSACDPYLQRELDRSQNSGSERGINITGCQECYGVND